MGKIIGEKTIPPYPSSGGLPMPLWLLYAVLMGLVRLVVSSVVLRLCHSTPKEYKIDRLSDPGEETSIILLCKR